MVGELEEEAPITMEVETNMDTMEDQEVEEDKIRVLLMEVLQLKEVVVEELVMEAVGDMACRVLMMLVVEEVVVEEVEVLHRLAVMVEMEEVDIQVPFLEVLQPTQVEEEGQVKLLVIVVPLVVVVAVEEVQEHLE